MPLYNIIRFSLVYQTWIDNSNEYRDFRELLSAFVRGDSLIIQLHSAAKYLGFNITGF